MPGPDPRPPADREAERLLALLGLERELLVKGRLDALPRIEVAKSEALTRLAARTRRADPDMLRRLRAAAAANQQLYAAALAGIRRVRDQVAALMAGGGAELRTYAPDGGRKALIPGHGTHEHRA